MDLLLQILGMFLSIYLEIGVILAILIMAENKVLAVAGLSGICMFLTLTLTWPRALTQDSK
jgi:hypothetical protein